LDAILLGSSKSIGGEKRTLGETLRGWTQSTLEGVTFL
jgi:hypothetical protein